MFQNVHRQSIECPKTVCDTPSGAEFHISISMLRQCMVFLFTSIFVVGSHFFRPWETADPAPQQAPVVPQPAQEVQLPGSNGHQDPDARQQEQNAQLLVPETHPNAPNVHQPAPDAPQPAQNAHQQALNAQLTAPDAHQQAPSAQLPVPDANQQAQNAQLPAFDEHQPAQMAPQPPQSSSPLNPYSQYVIHGAGLMNFYMHALGALGRHFPFHQSMLGSTMETPTYLPWTASMHPPLPAPLQNPHFPVPPTTWNPGLHPQIAPGYPPTAYISSSTSSPLDSESTSWHTVGGNI